MREERPLPEPFAKKVQGVRFHNDYSSFFYVRIEYRNALGIVKSLGDICARHDVSVYSLLQKPGSKYFVLIAEDGPVSRVKKVAVDIEAGDWCVGDVFYMPIAAKD